MKMACVIPTTGRAELFEICLPSVLAQSIPFSEIVVVSDAKMPLCIPDKFKNVGIMYSETGGGKGGPAARCIGFERAKADLVVMLDDDDYLDTNFNKMIYNIEQNLESIGLIIPSVRKVWTEGCIPRAWARPPSGCSGLMAKDALMQWLPSTSSGLIINKKVFQELPVNALIKGFNDVQLVRNAMRQSAVYYCGEAIVYFLQYFSRPRMTSSVTDRRNKLLEASKEGLIFSKVEQEKIVASALFSEARSEAYRCGLVRGLKSYVSGLSSHKSELGNLSFCSEIFKIGVLVWLGFFRCFRSGKYESSH
jgi:glycosyltransferase involved in cell wall biosynthesis